MAKRDYFLIIDTETTINDHVVDFGAVLCDRKGRIYTQCGVLVKEYFGTEALFYLSGEDANSIWSKQGKDRRFDAYQKMIEQGTRMLASVASVNRWLEKVQGKYSPIVTAYNLAFDRDKCQKTAIDLTMFQQSFCLWHAAADKWGHSREYRQFILDSHEFRPRTDLGNMSYRTAAEPMARFVLNNPDMPDEPHTALEDALYYELPILTRLVRDTPKKQYLNPPGFNWRDYQIKDWFTPK
jgi:hypothetical protein